MRILREITTNPIVQNNTSANGSGVLNYLSSITYNPDESKAWLTMTSLTLSAEHWLVSKP